MKTLTIYSKVIVILLVLVNINACKKSETVIAPPIVEKPCTISKIEYGNGEYDEYKFNSSGQAIQEDGYTKDVDGKIVHAIATFSYDNNGLLAGSKFDGGSEKYTYANGALNLIDVLDDKNKSIYKVTVITDANKRIVGMKDSNNFTSKITRDALGNFSKSELYDDKNQLIQREIVSSYDGKKNWRASLLGWSLDVTSPNTSYIYYGGYFNEPSGGGIDDVLYSVFDKDGNNTGKLTLANNFTYSKQFNSKGYPTQVILKDAVDAVNNSTRTYSYSDCP